MQGLAFFLAGFADWPADGEQAFDLVGPAQAQQALDRMLIEPAQPAAAQPFLGGLQDKVLAGDAEIASHKIGAAPERADQSRQAGPPPHDGDNGAGILGKGIHPPGAGKGGPQPGAQFRAVDNDELPGLGIAGGGGQARRLQAAQQEPGRAAGPGGVLHGHETRRGRQRPQATANALFAFLSNRVGDAGFLLGISLAVWSVGTLEWPALAGNGELATVTVRLLVFGFVVAALAKSAQLPFSPWIARALEGPTPSSAVFYGSLMVHAGVYLLLRLEPLLVQVPDVMALIAIIGLATALYGALCALVQSDVKSALIFSTLTQVGLMFLACGLGFFGLAAWHLALHAAWRAYQFLLAPSYMHLVAGAARPVPRWLAARPWLYTAAVQGFWIEPLARSLLARPTVALGRDMRSLDERVIDRLVGVPREDQADDVREVSADELIRGHGVAGRVLFQVADRLLRLEARLLLSGSGALQQHLRHAGKYMEALELMLEQPRYLMLMVMATFVVIL